MNHNDHVNLLRGGVPSPNGVWADLGSGTGAFTLALADLLDNQAQIFSVDTDKRAIQEQEWIMQSRFPDAQVEYRIADFSKPLDLPPLDGVVMANSLHFHHRKDAILQLVKSYLKTNGQFILVEYNADSGNPWVPYPISFDTWKEIALRNGFAETRLLHTVPSRFLREIYSAVSWQSQISA